VPPCAINDKLFVFLVNSSTFVGPINQSVVESTFMAQIDLTRTRPGLWIIWPQHRYSNFWRVSIYMHFEQDL